MAIAGGARDRLRRRPALAAFAGVFAAVLCGFLAIGAVLPVLPRYVRGPVGAGDVAVGVVVGAFAATAFLGRPVGGRLADGPGGRRRIVVAGLALATLGGALLFVPAGVPGLVVARLVLGLGDGWMFTAGVTWIVDLAPGDRRGQAIGMFGLAVWGGVAVGSVLGQALLDAGSYEAVWAFATAAPAVGALLARRVGEPPRAPDVVAAAAASRRTLRAFVPAAAIAPGLALALANVGYGTLAAFVVLLLDDRGIGHGALAFTAFASALVAARLMLGRVPDRVGARRSAVASALGQGAGLVVLATAGSLPAALAGAVVMGTGMSLLFPSLALLVVARAGEASRGAAMGAFTAFFDVGVGLGAPLAGAIAALAGYEAAFLVAACFSAAGAAAAALGGRREGVRSRA
jgi:MFS family permease